MAEGSLTVGAGFFGKKIDKLLGMCYPYGGEKSFFVF